MNRFILIFSIFCLTLVGCSDNLEPENLTQFTEAEVSEEVIITRLDTTDIATIDDLLTIDLRLERCDSRAAIREIGSITPVSNEEGDVLLYVINYAENKGFRILSAKKEFDPIVAYSNEGNFDVDRLNHSGLSQWFDNLKEQIANTSQLPDSTRLFNRMEWSRLLARTEKRSIEKTRSVDIVNYKKQIDDELIEYNRQGYMVYPLSDFIPFTNFSPTFANGILPPEFIARQISNISNKEVIEDSYVILKTTEKKSDPANKKIMVTEWNQDYPYNQSIPVYPDQPRLLGCTTVALGQIIAHTRGLTGYNYDAMFSDVTDYREISRFLYDIGCALGIHYQGGHLGATIYEVQSALIKSRFTFNHISNFDIKQIESSIKSNCPVYVQGSGTAAHAWVVDGYDYRTVEGDCKVLLLNAYQEDIIGESIFWCYGQKTEIFSDSKLYHCNWGYGGLYNGFYANGHFEPGSENYNSNIQMLSFIHKY